jgi:hypothetical protein
MPKYDIQVQLIGKDGNANQAEMFVYDLGFRNVLGSI